MLRFYQNFNASNPKLQLSSLKIYSEKIIGLCDYHQASQDELLLNDFVLTYVLRGEKVLFLDKQKIEMKTGDLLFLPKNTWLFSDILWQQKAFTSINILLKPLIINEFVEFVNTPTTLDFVQSPVLIRNEYIQNYFASLLPYFKEQSLDLASLLKFKFFELLLLLKPKIFNQSIHNQLLIKTNLKEENLKSVVCENLYLPVSLPELAYKSSLSLSSFKRHFKQIFHASPRQWVLDKRLEKAYFYLQTTDKTVKEVCYEVGFEHISHFIRLFKRKYGQTPRTI